MDRKKRSCTGTIEVDSNIVEIITESLPVPIDLTEELKQTKI